MRSFEKDKSNLASQSHSPFFQKKGHPLFFGSSQNPNFFSSKSNEAIPTIQRKTDQTTIQGAPSSQPECASYDRGEVERSHRESGLLPYDVFIPGTMPGITQQGLIIADFGVDWGSVKESTKSDPYLQYWVREFEDNPDRALEIIGYSDCVGVEAHNDFLRNRRASKVFGLFDKAQLRVIKHEGARANEYLTDNTTPVNRAINRGVLIRFSQNIDYDPEVIEVPKPIPPPIPDTEGCDKTQKEALAHALERAKNMVIAALGEIDNVILMRTYFGPDAMDHQYHIRGNFVDILKGLKSGPTFECNDPDSWWCDGAVARVLPVVGDNIHICPAAITNGEDYLARTIVHEAGHRYAWIFIPDDLCAGGWTGDTTDAEDNADCYGEFAGEALSSP